MTGGAEDVQHQVASLEGAKPRQEALPDHTSIVAVQAINLHVCVRGERERECHLCQGLCSPRTLLRVTMATQAVADLPILSSDHDELPDVELVPHERAAVPLLQ